jgi:hypothetical protein
VAIVIRCRSAARPGERQQALPPRAKSLAHSAARD